MIYVQGVTKKTAQSLRATILQPYVTAMWFVQKENEKRTKASV